jgi:hypothetical protein
MNDASVADAVCTNEERTAFIGRYDSVTAGPGFVKTARSPHGSLIWSVTRIDRW